MSEEATLIVNAIESLRVESNWFKDYLFPIVSVFLSAILGAWVAYFALHHQERIQLEKEKLRICNQWMIRAEGLFQSLMAYKDNYAEEIKISRHPYDRALNVRFIIGHSKPLDENVANLSFIVPTKDDPSSLDVKWRNLSRISGMIVNYNLILQFWEKRNEIERPLREKLISEHGEKGRVDLSHAQIEEWVEPKDLTSLIDLTEKAIHLTDDLIIESYNFLEEFPDVAKSVINTRKLKKYGYGYVLTPSINENAKSLLKRCPEVDYDILGNIYGMSKEEIQRFYNYGY